MHKKSQGFTLIELMVVISIIGLLAVAILPSIIGSTITANQAVDKLNLKWQFDTVMKYKARHKTGPRGGGHRFVLDPWVRNVVEHTVENRDRYFTPMASEDDFVAELKTQEIETIWKDRDDLTSQDTHWAGLAAEHKRGMFGSGKVIWMATDNEGGNIYRDGSVAVLAGNGACKMWIRDPDFIKYGYSADVDEGEHIEVGPNSRHPDLMKLEH